MYELIFISFTIFLGVFIAFIIRKTLKPMVIRTSVLMLAILFLITGGMFYFINFAHLKTSWEKSEWPITTGLVDTSYVVGERAFRPVIVYSYFVEGKSFHDSTNLQVPGFGGRLNRLDAAEKLAAYYHKDRETAVYYNPDQPQESLLRAGASHTIYLSISLGAILMCTGFILLLLRTFPKKMIN